MTFYLAPLQPIRTMGAAASTEADKTELHAAFAAYTGGDADRAALSAADFDRLVAKAAPALHARLLAAGGGGEGGTGGRAG